MASALKLDIQKKRARERRKERRRGGREGRRKEGRKERRKKEGGMGRGGRKKTFLLLFKSIWYSVQFIFSRELEEAKHCLVFLFNSPAN